jgi:hypothetical protein
MAKFTVNLEGAPGSHGGSPTPRERKPIHPGLQQLVSSVQCLGCGDFLEWSSLSNSMSVSHCNCGLWVRDRKDFYRLIHWSSPPFLPNTGPVYPSK